MASNEMNGKQQETKWQLSKAIERHCVDMGYRFGRKLGQDFYTIALNCYWIDNKLDEQQVVVKVIDFKQIECQNLFETKSHHKYKDNVTKTKEVKVTLGPNKTISIETTNSGKFIPDFITFRKEIKQLMSLSHQNLVIIKDIMFFNEDISNSSDNITHILMFIEFCDNNLKQLLKDREQLSTKEIINWSVQIARGLAYLHSRGISHSNLKPSNILFFAHKAIKGEVLLRLSDFGLSMLFPLNKVDDNLQNNPQNPNDCKRYANDVYRDPVIDHIFSKLSLHSNSEELTYDAIKADIWSQSVLIAEFVLNFKVLSKLFKKNANNLDKLGEVYVNAIKKMPNISNDLIDLLSKTLIYKQSCRLDIIGICHHKWLANELQERRKVTIKITDGSFKSQYDDSDDEDQVPVNDVHAQSSVDYND